MRRAAQDALAELRRPADPRQATSALLERLMTIEKQNQNLEKKIKELASRLDGPKKASKRGQPHPPGSECSRHAPEREASPEEREDYTVVSNHADLNQVPGFMNPTPRAKHVRPRRTRRIRRGHVS